MITPKQKTSNLKSLMSVLIRMTLFAVAVMWPAGTIIWWEAWAIIVLWTLFSIIMVNYFSRHDPELLAERMKLLPIQKEQKTWDKIMMLMFVIGGIALYIVPGFDVIRYQWSLPLPIWLEIVAMLVHLPCFWFLWWVMRENTYLSQVVKIDEQRGHQVITTGPYALVRHPMYSVIIVLLFVLPLALGSRYALLLSVLLTALLVVRTYFEDQTLCNELQGYSEYTRKTPYRLIPGIW